MNAPATEPIGVRCFPIRMDDGSYIVMGRRESGTTQTGLRADGEFSGPVPFSVAREMTGVVVTVKPSEETPTSTRVPFWVPSVGLTLTQTQPSEFAFVYGFNEPGSYRNPYRQTEFWMVILINDVEVISDDHPDQLIEAGDQGQDVAVGSTEETYTVQLSIYTDSSLQTLVATATESITIV